MQKCTFFFVLTLALPGYLQQPSSDVRLCLDSTTCTTVIPNNTILHPGNISNAGLLCVSSLDENGIGNWFYPSGEQIINQQSSVFSSLQRIRHVGLFRGGAAFTSAAEGVYTCRIPDGSRVQQTLYVGIYQTSSYMNSGGPVLETPVGFHLLTPLSSQPPSFILNCTSTQSPPTTVTWTRNGETLNSRSPEYSMNQVLRNATSTTYNNLLTVRGSQEGEYSCTVSNDRGALSANFSVASPSGRPVNVTAEAIGNNQVRVTWVPAANVRGYQLVYTTNTSADMNSVNIEDPTAVEHTLRNFSAGVRYTIRVVAYANLPSEASDPVSIELRLPAVPTDVQATTNSSTRIRVSWREPLGGEVITGFEVSYTPVNSCPGTPGGRRMVEGRGITQFTLTGLQPFTNYSIYVRANASQGLGPASMPAVFEMTQADVPTGPPQNVTVSVTGTTIVVRWTPPACRDKNGDTLSYVVRYGPSAGSSSEMETTALFYRLTELTVFTEYSIQVAARHPTAGTGPFSNPVTAMIIGRPSEVTSPVATPDIVSVLLSWEPPINGHGTITQYMVAHGLADSQNLIASRVLSGNTTSYRVMQLIPETTYRFAVTPSTSAGEGPPQRLTETTQSIGQVQSVVFRSLNSGAINVSWQRLSSQDIVYYKVYFSGGSALFPGRSSWGVVEGGGQFEVAAVVIVEGRQVEGERSTPALSAGGGSVMIAIIAGAAGGGLIVIILVVITIFFICLVWFRRQTNPAAVPSNKATEDISSIPMEECKAYGKVVTTSPQHDPEAEYEMIDSDPYEHVT